MNLILTHDHSDFDAVASQLGAWKVQPESVPIVPRYVNRNVRDFLTLYWDALPFRRAEELPPDASIVRVLLVDTQTIPTVKGYDLQHIEQVHVVDHHEPRKAFPTGWTMQIESTGSCATLFVEAVAERKLPLSWIEATLLLLGIHEDTGSLVYASTTARDAQGVAWLLEQGADLDILRRHLDQPLSPRQQMLYKRLIEESEALDINGFQVVLAQATAEEYVDDISSLARSLRDLYDPAALFLVVQLGHDVQVVARSTTDEIDVGHLMKALGGGGHSRAAAAFIEGEERAAVSARLTHILPQHVQPAVTVSDWMSRGKIRTLPPATTVQEAAELMQRWGHEGFPVVDKQGEVIGVLTRRDVDRALQHKLGNAAITEFMHKGNITVTPHDSIARVQRVMTEWNIGQVPVVAPDSREIVGIITRTDLLKRHGASTIDTGAEQMMRKVANALPEPALALVRRIALEAAHQGYQPYLVGGIVRDLLLGVPIRDLDIVIEGNAIPVARQMAEKLGGRVVAHERFGTAKWILRDPNFPPRDSLLEQEVLPEHIDLITARTEFYVRPTALPQVEHASIKQDLHRRDFTINTLAIALAPGREGQLLDFYGGKADLERGVIRVLHNLSFVEDPTRILRAIRFEQRFGFALEPRTAELLQASLDLLKEVSPDRLRHELFLILQEEEAERILARLDDLGIMRYLMPDVRWDASDAARLQRLREAGIDIPEALLTALIWDPTAQQARIDRVADRLALSREWRDRLHTLYEVRSEADALTVPDVSNSELYNRLRGRDAHALELLALLTEDTRLKSQLRLFLDDLRHRTLAISGNDLRHSGLPPGPVYQQILDTIHAAMLDGEAPDADTQRALLEREVEGHRNAGT